MKSCMSLVERPRASPSRSAFDRRRSDAAQQPPARAAAAQRIGSAVQGPPRLQSLARHRRDQVGPPAAREGVAEVPEVLVARQELRRARHDVDDDQQSGHRRRDCASRRCTSRRTSTATRSRARKSSLYTVWYLMENYDRIPQIKKLVDERVFYVVPTVNPDGRDHFLKGTGAGARTGSRAGRRRQRRRGGRGRRRRSERQRRDRADPQVRAGQGQPAHEHARQAAPRAGAARRNGRLGHPRQRRASTTTATAASTKIRSAATTGTATGRPTGSRTTSRAARWTIRSSLPEARAINDFLMAHPNIAGVQSYHNNGGMILRGPGAEWQGEYPRADVSVYDELGRQGERMLPVLPLPGDLERPLHRARRLHRLDQRRPRHAVVLERAVERRAVLQQSRARRAAAQSRQPDRGRAPRTSISTTSSSSAISTSSGRRSIIRSSARSRWAGGRRRRDASRRGS